MKVGYARVSTIEQNEERQIISLQEADCEKIFLDKCSGKNKERPRFQEMMNFCRDGDILLVSEFSRLARSTRDLLSILEELQQKNVQVISLKENLDTNTPQGKLMLTVFAGIAEFERTLMLQRQREGIAIAKAKGKYKGKSQKPRPENWEELKNKYMSRQIQLAKIAKMCKVSRPTVYKWLKADGINFNEA